MRILNNGDNAASALNNIFCKKPVELEKPQFAMLIRMSLNKLHVTFEFS